jgi:hypothetical protein
VDACNPLLQAHPTWARDEHEGRGIPTSLTPVAGRLAPSPLRARPRARPIWAGARGDTHSSARETPRSRNADNSIIIYVVFFSACMRCTRLCPLNPGVTHTTAPCIEGVWGIQRSRARPTRFGESPLGKGSQS